VSDSPGHSTALRAIADGPWCWQSKAARRRIREAFDATRNVTSALAVYDALCEIASDHQAETFAAAHAWIANKSGVSVSLIQRHLKVLAELQLVRISTPTLRAPSTYSLLAFGSDDRTPGNGYAAFGLGQKTSEIPRYEESEKKRKKNGGAAPGPSAGQRSAPRQSIASIGAPEPADWQRRIAATRPDIAEGNASRPWACLGARTQETIAAALNGS